MCVCVLGLNDDEEAALIELMMCAVKQATEGSPATARALGKKVEREREGGNMRLADTLTDESICICL